ncbi:MAG: DUF2807 domain-containing protein [Paramuribaculum sp.]|nr:DUF2807 domain-containing protein [Paramuribaculum sp.]
MTRIITFLTIFLVTLTAQANIVIEPSSSYKKGTVPVQFSGIKEIVTQSMIDIDYYNSPTQKVEVYAPENITKYITVTHKDKNLSVKFNQSLTIKGNCTVKITVYSPDVTSFRTNSSGNIRLMNAIERDSEVVCSTNSSGDITGSIIKAPRIKLITNSSGDIKFDSLKGTSFNAMCNSSGDIRCESAIAHNVNLYSNSSGDVFISRIVSNSFSAATNSSGDISVTKSLNSANVKAVSSSSGDIRLSGITCDIIEATSGSSSSIILRGVCDSAKLSASSCSDILAGGLKAKTVTATTTSSSSCIKCYAVNRLEMRQAKNNTIFNSALGHNTRIITEN